MRCGRVSWKPRIEWKASLLMTSARNLELDVKSTAISSPRSGRRRLQFSLRALLILATVSCLILTALYVKNEHRLAKRKALAVRLESLNVEVYQRTRVFLRLAARDQGPVERDLQKRLQLFAPLEEKERELKQLQIEANDLSLEISSIDISSPTWYQRIQSFVTASNN
jgi:hypothetical protein